MTKLKTFQGDVDVRIIEKIPESAKLLDTKTVMLGEKSGHNHTFLGQVLVYEPNKGDTITVRDDEKILVSKYVNVLEDTKLVHQEHDVDIGGQSIEKGLYVITQEREWDVLENQIRPAMD